MNGIRFDIKDIEIEGPREWMDRFTDLASGFAEKYGDALERVLTEIGPERVSHILHPEPRNRTMERQIIGHEGELLGVVWVEWPEPNSVPYAINIRCLIREHGT